MACTFANITALPFTAWSAPGTELIMALFHSVLPVILKDHLHFIDKGLRLRRVKYTVNRK